MWFNVGKRIINHPWLGMVYTTWFGEWLVIVLSTFTSMENMKMMKIMKIIRVMEVMEIVVMMHNNAQWFRTIFWDPHTANKPNWTMLKCQNVLSERNEISWSFPSKSPLQSFQLVSLRSLEPPAAEAELFSEAVTATAEMQLWGWNSWTTWATKSSKQNICFCIVWAASSANIVVSMISIFVFFALCSSFCSGLPCDDLDWQVASSFAWAVSRRLMCPSLQEPVNFDCALGIQPDNGKSKLLN